MNEAAGAVANSDVGPEQVRQIAASLGIDAQFLTFPAGGLERVTRKAIKLGSDGVVAVGGDGTVSAIAGVLAGGKVPLGVLPMGTFNHFAKDAGLPLKLEDALQVIAQKNIRHVDVGEVNGRVFINNSSIGGYPEAVRERDEQRSRSGRKKWLAMLLASLRVFRRYPLLRVKLELDGHIVFRTTPFVFVGNNEYKMSFFTYSARHHLDGGKLSVYTANCQNRREFLRLFWLYLTNGLQQAENFESHTVTELWVETRKHHLRVAADGEVMRMQLPLHYQIRPRALKVFVPLKESSK